MLRQTPRDHGKIMHSPTKPHCKVGTDGDTDAPRTHFETGNIVSSIDCCNSLLCQQQLAPKTSSQGLVRAGTAHHALYCCVAGVHTCLWISHRGGGRKGEANNRRMKHMLQRHIKSQAQYQMSGENAGAEITKQRGSEDKLPPTRSVRKECLGFCHLTLPF